MVSKADNRQSTITRLKVRTRKEQEEGIGTGKVEGFLRINLVLANYPNVEDCKVRTEVEIKPQRRASSCLEIYDIQNQRAQKKKYWNS